MANIFERFSNWWRGEVPPNSYNAAAYSLIGGLDAVYDYNNKSYIEAFRTNPDVFAMVQQMTDKTIAVPYYIRKIKSEESLKEYRSLQYATKGNLTPMQLGRLKMLESRTFENDYKPFPLEQPNPNQTWADIFALFKTYYVLTGNVYFYLQKPKDGVNAGVPRQFYVLPSHLVKIVLKKDADLLSDENVIDKYMLTDGASFVEFPEEDVIHVKTTNPSFDFNGNHLYGMSRLSAALKNITASDAALDNNVKTMRNSGVFGFITAKDANTPFTAEQAISVKEKLVEMDLSNSRLSKIAGASVPIDFTRLSLSTDELKPFEYLKHNQKAIANVLGWSDALLNNDDGGRYDKQKEERKRVITDNIQPDLIKLAEALNKEFIPLFKGYENHILEWDITELPEMQEDFKEMLEWMNNAPITPNEIREAIKYNRLEMEGMDSVWINAGKKRVDELGLTASDINKAWEQL